MSRLGTLGTFVTLSAALWAFSCSSDEPEENPHFMAGDAGSPAGGEPSNSADAGHGPGQGVAGAPDPTTGGGGSGGSDATAGAPTDVAGAGGMGPETPPYDCVLHPTTHLEIINACTDAVRIEKHPNLPPVKP